MTIEELFITSDGFRLRRLATRWTDGDLEFEADQSGHPLDSEGRKIKGDYLSFNDDQEANFRDVIERDGRWKKDLAQLVEGEVQVQEGLPVFPEIHQVRFLWDDTNYRDDQGWFVEAFTVGPHGGDELVVDSEEHPFPIDVDEFESREDLQTALAVAFPGAEITLHGPDRPKTIECPACSRVAGADMPVHHDPPPCTDEEARSRELDEKYKGLEDSDR